MGRNKLTSVKMKSQPLDDGIITSPHTVDADPDGIEQQQLRDGYRGFDSAQPPDSDLRSASLKNNHKITFITFNLSHKLTPKLPPMKKLITLSLILFALSAFSQNNSPEVAITLLEVDQSAEEVNISYALQDLDGDACDVWLKVSVDGGQYFNVVPGEEVSGDVGSGITSDGGLFMTWNYAGITANLEEISLRVFASDNQEVSISEMVDQVNETELLNGLLAIEGERHYLAAPDHLEETRSFLLDEFIAAGLQSDEHNFILNGSMMTNILGRQAGEIDESITFVIDGHFDGVPGSPAADDNGSAVAGVLEAVRILSQYNFEHSIRFIGFDAEELGLVGSANYVSNGIEDYEDIQGVLNMEMIGYYDNDPDTQDLPFGFGTLFPDAAAEVSNDDNRGNFLFACGNVDSNPLLSAYLSASAMYVSELRIISVAVPGNGSIAPDLRRSDHATFWDNNIQALMLTDTSEFRNDNYHTSADSVGTINFEFMANVVKATIATCAELAVPISAGFDEVALSSILSIEGPALNIAKVNIYPNPSDGLLSVELEANQAINAQVQIFESTGKLVHDEVVLFSAGTSTSILDLQHLPVGAYVLTIQSDKVFRSLGFVIE